MTKNKGKTRPLVDPGLYTLAHNQEYLAPEFLTRNIASVQKLHHRSARRRKQHFRLFSWLKRKQKTAKEATVHTSRTSSPRLSVNR